MFRPVVRPYKTKSNARVATNKIRPTPSCDDGSPEDLVHANHKSGSAVAVQGNGFKITYADLSLGESFGSPAQL